MIPAELGRKNKAKYCVTQRGVAVLILSALLLLVCLIYTWTALGQIRSGVDLTAVEMDESVLINQGESSPLNVNSQTQQARCHGTQYTQGTWTLDESKNIQSFPCCHANASRDSRDPFCKGNVPQVFGHELKCLEWGFLDRYRWNPSECTLPAWNAKDFCEILGNRTVLIIGDSLGGQTAATLKNNIMFVDKEHRSGQKCLSQIRYAMGDTLVGRVFVRRNKGDNWKDSVRRVRPDLVVLSVGGHIGTTEQYLEVLSEVKRDLEQEILPEFPDLQVIWRTIVPTGCQVKMLEQHPQNISGYWDDYTVSGKPYGPGYRRHYLWDQEAKKVWSGSDRVKIIDLEPLAYRSDAHPSSNQDPASTPEGTLWDCTHMCLPGPLDLFSRLLLNTMRDLREQHSW